MRWLKSLPQQSSLFPYSLTVYNMVENMKYRSLPKFSEESVKPHDKQSLSSIHC